MYDVQLRLAQQIKQLRKTRGLTQLELAKQAGVTSETVARVERVLRGAKSADFNPSLDTLLRLSDALHVELSALLASEAPQRHCNDRLVRLLRQARPEAVQMVVRVAEVLLACDSGTVEKSHHPQFSSRARV